MSRPTSLDGALLAESLLERNGTLFQIVAGFVFMFGAAVLGWFFGQRNRKSKTFDYRVLSDVTIVASHRRPERLSVLFGAREVKNPFITEIEFKNTGTGAIQKSDFLQPAQIVRPEAEILDWAVIEQSERDLVLHSDRVAPLDGQKQPEYIQIHPETLNKQDSFVVQIVYDGDHKQPLDISCRILDESRAMREIAARKNTLEVFLLDNILVAGLAALVFGAYASIKSGEWSQLTISTLVVSFAAVSFFAYVRAHYHRNKRLP